MTRLLLDIGNSRVKWAMSDSPERMQARLHGGDPVEAYTRVLESEGPVDSLAFVDVTGRLATALPAGFDARRLEATASACGVTNGYADPGRLGADRWAALLGARAAVDGPACIIDAGTALTADVLADDGRHLGGWIAPGMRLGAAALARETRLQVSPGQGDGTPFGRDTANAIAAGTRAAALGFIGRAFAAAQDALGVRPSLLLAGGDARALAADLEEAIVIEHLVLLGLAHWAEGT